MRIAPPPSPKKPTLPPPPTDRPKKGPSTPWSADQRTTRRPPVDSFRPPRPSRSSPYERFNPQVIRVNREGVVIAGTLNRSVKAEIFVDTLNRTASVRETEFMRGAKDRQLTKTELAALKRNFDQRIKAGDTRPELASARAALGVVR